MKEEKKVVLFLHDGVISGGFTTDPEIHVTVCDYDRDLDDAETKNAFWDECKGKEMLQFEPVIMHPNAESMKNRQRKGSEQHESLFFLCPEGEKSRNK